MKEVQTITQLSCNQSPHRKINYKSTGSIDSYEPYIICDVYFMLSSLPCLSPSAALCIVPLAFVFSVSLINLPSSCEMCTAAQIKGHT